MTCFCPTATPRFRYSPINCLSRDINVALKYPRSCHYTVAACRISGEGERAFSEVVWFQQVSPERQWASPHPLDIFQACSPLAMPSGHVCGLRKTLPVQSSCSTMKSQRPSLYILPTSLKAFYTHWHGQTPSNNLDRIELPSTKRVQDWVWSFVWGRAWTFRRAIIYAPQGFGRPFDINTRVHQCQYTGQNRYELLTLNYPVRTFWIYEELALVGQILYSTTHFHFKIHCYKQYESLLYFSSCLSIFCRS